MKVKTKKEVLRRLGTNLLKKRRGIKDTLKNRMQRTPNPVDSDNSPILQYSQGLTDGAL